MRMALALWRFLCFLQTQHVATSNINSKLMLLLSAISVQSSHVSAWYFVQVSDSQQQSVTPSHASLSQSTVGFSIEYLVICRFYPDLQWYVDVSLQLIERGGDFASKEIWHSIVQLVTNYPQLHGYAASKVSTLPLYLTLHVTWTRPILHINLTGFIQIVSHCSKDMLEFKLNLTVWYLSHFSRGNIIQWHLRGDWDWTAKGLAMNAMTLL